MTRTIITTRTTVKSNMLRFSSTTTKTKQLGCGVALLNGQLNLNWITLRLRINNESIESPAHSNSEVGSVWTQAEASHEKPTAASQKVWYFVLIKPGLTVLYNLFCVAYWLFVCCLLFHDSLLLLLFDCCLLWLVVDVCFQLMTMTITMTITTLYNTYCLQLIALLDYNNNDNNTMSIHGNNK